jgi:phenylpropionate dioxygenase-like ring-hydroxylating dioxygenase large terminal subunit
MEDMLVADIRERVAEERSRKGPPEDFPTLPDVPMARYSDPDYYRLEVERIFKRRWLFACNESEVAEPGQFKLLDIPFAPVVVARGRDGVLRAFLNTCRHRGAAVVTQECGKAKFLTCPYHAWSYDLSGKLVGVSDKAFFGDLDRESRSLIPVRCEQWGTFVFVNLDKDAVPLAEDLAPLIDRFSDFMNAKLRLVTKRSYDVKANWKIPMDGFLESYHVATVHVKSGGNIFDGTAGANVLFPNGHSSMFTPFFEAIDVDAFFPREAPEIEDTRIFEDLNPNMLCFPNTVWVMNASSAPAIQIWPIGIDTCRMNVYWYAVDWGDAPHPPGWEMKVEGFDAVFAEDVELYEPMQRSLAAATGAGIPLQFREARVFQFHVELDRQIGFENVAGALATPNVLDSYIEA